MDLARFAEDMVMEPEIAHIYQLLTDHPVGHQSKEYDTGALPMEKLPKFEETRPIAEESAIEIRHQQQMTVVDEKTPPTAAPGVPTKLATRRRKVRVVDQSQSPQNMTSQPQLQSNPIQIDAQETLHGTPYPPSKRNWPSLTNQELRPSSQSQHDDLIRDLTKTTFPNNPDLINITFQTQPRPWPGF